MADASITSLDVQDDGLHIYGTNFTQTTTIVLVNDVNTPSTFVNSTELLVAPPPAEGASIVVEKGSVQTETLVVPGADAPVPAAPGLPPTPEDLAREQEKGGTNPTSPPVEPGPKVETMDDLGIEPGMPYPTGGTPDAEAQFVAAHGYRRAPPEPVDEVV